MDNHYLAPKVVVQPHASAAHHLQTHAPQPQFYKVG